MARSDMWSTRLYHEGMFHEHSSFLTLTYSDANLPDDYSVSVRPLQLFMKRLRKRNPDRVFRYFACGEYGDETLRPHYHIVLFGHSFPDKRPWRKTTSGYLTYRSPELEKLWPLGHAEIGTVTPQSCAYVARYVMKKVTGEPAREHYQRIHPLTGELVRVQAEFLVMSKNIGAEWFEKFHTDAFPSDFVTVDGIKKPVPRYYAKKLKARADLTETADTVLQKREAITAGPDRPDDTPERRAVREECLAIKTEQLKRDYDNGA